MSAIDTFDWLVHESIPHPDDAQKKFIEGKRDYMLRLRSEDERKRCVEELTLELHELRATGKSNPKS